MSIKKTLIEQIEQIQDEKLLEKCMLILQNQGTEEQKQIDFLNAKSEKIAHIISYEFASPINSLKTISDLLLLDVENIDDPMVQDSAKYLHDQIENLQKKIGNLLVFADLEVKNYDLKIESIELDSIISQIIRSYEKQALLKEVHLVNHILPKFKVMADKKMIFIVLNNLVQNAVKFSRKGDQVEVLLEKSVDSLKIIVKDSGIGMGKAKIASIFDPSRKPTQKGTASESGLSLGMVVVKSILELHQTTLAIESTQGKGTSVSFSLSST
ncbi:MAG: sensor histidine kinase [Bacteroidetes bacterium]|nr:MAG: sensor histidine kinase [Bacteroidota bacterium]